MEDLPVEQSELLDIDFDLLEQQQFGSQQLDDTARESWADQQDQPEGLNPNVDLIDLGGDGAASGAPIAVDPEPVVEGPPNYNIFHGESPPRLIETKEEEIGSGVAPSAPVTQPVSVKKEEQIEEAAPVDPIGDVDYDPDDLELDEAAPGEGAAPSAPSSAPREDEFQKVRRRGTRGGMDEKRKSFKRQFHQVGLPSAHRWLRDYTTRNCGESFELENVYLTDTPDFTPVVRFVGNFEEHDANADPILTIARYLRYFPALKTFLNNRCPALLQHVYQRNRQLYQEHKDRPFGSNPLDYYEHPVRARGEPIRPDHEGVGAQFHRNLLAGKYPDLVVHQDQQVVEEGPPSSGWRPSLRLPVQPSEPPPDRPPNPQGRSNPIQRIPSPPNYPPPNFSPVEVRQFESPPLPPPTEPPPVDSPLVLPRDRPQQPQHPPGPPRSARLEQQALSRTDPNTSRGRGVTRGAAPGAPTSRPKVVLRERDSSDPRDNRKSSGVILRPSSASAAPRTSTPSRTVQLEAPQQPEPDRQVFVEEEAQIETGEGAAPGAPDPAEETPSAPLREEPEGAEEEEEEPNERSRSEPPKLRLKSLRESPTSRPLALRPRVTGYPEIRFDSVGTWALIAPAPKAPVTKLIGAKSSRRVNPSPKPGVEPKLTTRQWSSGPNTEFYHLDEEESDDQQSEEQSSEELIPASDDHRSTSSDPPSVLPKRTSSQAYSHSPPPTSRDIPHSRFHQPKRVQSPRERHQPLQGTVEAPAFEDQVRRPEPPPPKKSRIEFGTRTVASGPSSSSRQLPISPPIKRTGQQGAASPEAHRPPSFGAPSSRGEIKQGETIRISSVPKVKVKAFPAKAYPKADSSPPPAPPQPLEPRKKSPPDVAKRAIEKERQEKELADQKAKAEAEKEQALERSAPPRSRSKNKISRGASKTPEPPTEQNWFRPTPPQERPDPPDLPSRPKRAAPSPKPPLPPPPLHQTLHQENKSRKAPPDKAPPARFVREQLEAERGAASGAPSRSSNLAPHPQADQGREPPTNPRQQHYRDAPRAQVLDWARHQVFRIGLDWHGVLDNNLNQFKVLDNRTAELIAGLSSADIPVEFAIVSFAGGARAPGLEQELTAFIGDCRHRGLPFIGYCITRERVGPGGKSDVVATHGINYFVDDTNYIVNEIRRTRAGAFLQPHHPQSHNDWIFELQNLLRNWRGSLADLCHHYRPLKLRPDQYSSDPKSNRGY